MIEAFLRFEGAACCEKEASPAIDARLKCCVCLNHSLILVHPYVKYICIVNKKDRRQFVVNIGNGTSEVSSVAITLVRSEDGDAYRRPASGSCTISLTETLILNQYSTASEVGGIAIRCA